MDDDLIYPFKIDVRQAATAAAMMKTGDARAVSVRPVFACWNAACPRARRRHRQLSPLHAARAAKEKGADTRTHFSSGRLRGRRET